MLLEALEQALYSGKSEKIQFGEALTIEHLLPQQWQAHWPLPSVPVAEGELERERLLHTIGNLTLLTKKLNPSVSNGAWTKKRDAILQHSALALNRSLPVEWNETRIGERSRELFDVACGIWPYPS
jgi:hypothetical protein